MRRSWFFVFILALTVLIYSVGSGFSAQAQEAAPDSQEEPAPHDKMDDVPDEYVLEAGAVYDRCLIDPKINQYYNCECFSLAYLDRRIALGHSATPSGIMNDLQGVCRDAVGAAGSIYAKCLSKATFLRPGTDPEKYCECVANTYVQSMDATTPRVSSRSIVSLQTYAYTACNRSQK